MITHEKLKGKPTFNDGIIVIMTGKVKKGKTEELYFGMREPSIFLDIEQGSSGVAKRLRSNVYIWPNANKEELTKWRTGQKSMAEIFEEVVDFIKKNANTSMAIRSLGIDSLDGLLDAYTKYDACDWTAYSAIYTTILTKLSELQKYGCDVIIIAHALTVNEKETLVVLNKGKDGKIGRITNQMVDAIIHYTITKGKRRLYCTDSGDIRIAGHRGMCLPEFIEIPEMKQGTGLKQILDVLRDSRSSEGISQAQTSKINVMAAKLAGKNKLTDKDGRLKIKEVSNQRTDSMKSLTKLEASKLIDWLDDQLKFIG